MVGRNLKIVETNKKHFTNEEKEQRENAQNKASKDFKEIQKSAPSHLDSVARYEYERVVSELKKLPVRNLDRSILESYASWYSIYRKAEDDIKRHGIFAHYSEIEEKENDKTGDIEEVEKVVILNTKKNPAIAIMNDATSQMKSCASLLGLTVDSRMKIFIPKQEDKPKSIFDKFGK